MNSTYSPLDLPRVKAWTKEAAFGLWDFLALEAGAEIAIAFSGLFWPEFVEVDGCVILRERYDPENFYQWSEKFDGKKSRIEEMMNHLHLWDLFHQDASEVPSEALEKLAEVLRKSWECALRERFPGRCFTVSVSTGESDYGPTLYFSSSDEAQGSSPIP